MIVTLDFETYSEADLKLCGAWRYAEHPGTEPICLAYSIDEAEVQRWRADAGDPRCPPALRAAIEGGAVMDAHNAAFERAIFERVMGPRYGWPVPDAHQWACTMARAASRGLPLALDALGAALDLPVRKDAEGKRLVQLLCKPRKATKARPGGRWSDEASSNRLVEYCEQDVRAEIGVRRALGPLPANEQRLFALDQKINARGLAVDVPAVKAAIDVVGQVERRLGGEFRALTGLGHGQVAETRAWLAKRGVEMDGLDKEAVAGALALDLPGEARRALELRQILAKASTKKLHKLLACVCDDGRVRGTQQYHGAFTGRWAGRLVQPQNLPRPVHEDADPDLRVADLMHRDAGYLDMVYGDAMVAVADALRNVFVAGPGMTFVSGDLAAIEAVGLAALAGQESKLDVFRRGDDPYCVAASAVFGYEVKNKKTHPKERQVGKVCELAFGYGGGVGAWRNFDSSDAHDDDQVKFYRDRWRTAHPDVVDLWAGLEDAALTAMSSGRGEYRGIVYALRAPYLVCVLPSGRSICYYDPRVEEYKLPWGAAAVRLTYMSVKEGRWQRVKTWGGKLTENVTQAVCRDVLVEGMFRAEAAGLPIVLTVHDEIVCEVAEDDLSAETTLREAMAFNPAWAAGWPIRSETWAGRRYRK